MGFDGTFRGRSVLYICLGRTNAAQEGGTNKAAGWHGAEDANDVAAEAATAPLHPSAVELVQPVHAGAAAVEGGISFGSCVPRILLRCINALIRNGGSL